MIFRYELSQVNCKGKVLCFIDFYLKHKESALGTAPARTDVCARSFLTHEELNMQLTPYIRWQDLRISFPASDKIYVQGVLYPEIRVPVRRVSMNGNREELLLYDTSVHTRILSRAWICGRDLRRSEVHGY